MILAVISTLRTKMPVGVEVTSTSVSTKAI